MKKFRVAKRSHLIFAKISLIKTWTRSGLRLHAEVQAGFVPTMTCTKGKGFISPLNSTLHSSIISPLMHSSVFHTANLFCSIPYSKIGQLKYKCVSTVNSLFFTLSQIEYQMENTFNLRILKQLLLHFFIVSVKGNW